MTTDTAPDLILHGGRVYTVDAGDRVVEALAIRGGRDRRGGRHRRDPPPRRPRHSPGRAGRPRRPAGLRRRPPAHGHGRARPHPPVARHRPLHRRDPGRRGGGGEAAPAGRVGRVQSDRRRARSLQDAGAPQGRALAHPTRPRSRVARQPRLHRAGDPRRARPRLRQHAPRSAWPESPATPRRRTA